jgi:hypothetical protein
LLRSLDPSAHFVSVLAVVYTLAAARLRLGRGKFTCPLLHAPTEEKREPWEPLHSPYLEGAVVLYRAKQGDKDDQYVFLFRCLSGCG